MTSLTRFLIFTALSFLICITLHSHAFAKTSVWKASKNGNSIYLGGTVHILKKEDFPLPCEFQTAYHYSDKLFFETDISALNSPALAQTLLQKGVYPAGEGLSKKLKPETLQSLKTYLASLGLPPESFLNFKPGMLLTIITIAELQKLGITGDGVDQHFYNLGKSDNKAISYFEEPEQQLDFLLQMGINNEDSFIKYVLSTVGKTQVQFPELMSSWRSGDLESISRSAELDELRSKFPQSYDAMLTRRNNNWLKKIDNLIDTAEVEYILVGAAHMAENEGLLVQLRKKGYKIEQLDHCAP